MDIYLFFMICTSLIVRLFFVESSNLLVEESYYWNYAQHLDFSYLDHPPMVALLIKFSTSLFGFTEFGVRITSLFCWLVMVFFSFKLSNLIRQGTGLYAVFFLSVLPFFFLQSLVITPDQPLVACWSATLYFLYRSIILNESKYWYAVGIWFGLGMLSKYTMVLLGPATLIYLCAVPSARQWFFRKEPYYCAFIIILFFMPVVYWNATHEWVSFVFQGARRFKSQFYFSFHHFVGLLVLFLMPPGIWGLWELFKKDTSSIISADKSVRRFCQIYTLFPLAWFGVFSLSHAIKFDWIGPALLPLIPWIAMLFSQKLSSGRNFLRNLWLIAAVGPLLIYTCMATAITLGTPALFNQKFLQKFINWSDLTQQLNKIANQVEQTTHTIPLFAPLDTYNVSSELAFYQTILFNRGDIKKIYPIVGRHIFDMDSLMYRYWSPTESLSGKTLILITRNRQDFDNPDINKHVTNQSPIRSIWSHSQGKGVEVELYYYRVGSYRSDPQV